MKKIFEMVDDDGQTTDSRALNCAVHGQISWNSELNRDLMAVLVTWKNEEDLIKNNKVNGWTPFSHYVPCEYRKDLIENSGDNAWTTFSPYKVYWDFFKCSRADNSAARGRIWLNFEPVRALMYVVVPCKYGKDPIEKS